jgi:hypothetical protein
VIEDAWGVFLCPGEQGRRCEVGVLLGGARGWPETAGHGGGRSYYNPIRVFERDNEAGKEMWAARVPRQRCGAICRRSGVAAGTSTRRKPLGACAGDIEVLGSVGKMTIL